jgi:5,10-methylenetetrahydrofolate reductase
MESSEEEHPEADEPFRARVILEACPPSLADREKAYAILRHSFSCYNTFHTISVPDIQDAGEFGRQRVRVPSDEFASWLLDLTGKPIILYKVAPVCTRPELEAWLEEVAAMGCRDIILVGPDSSTKEYKEGALQVGEAARIAARKRFRCGGIIIPTRRRQFVARPASVDEVERVETKVKEFGLVFFTTQIIYESEWMCCLLLDLVRRLSPGKIPKIFLTFSPFVCADDLNFARKFLGVHIPADVEHMLLGARSMREASISFLLRIWERISTFAREIGFPIQKLGVNAEYIDSRNPRNVDAAFELAEEFGRLLRHKS